MSRAERSSARRAAQAALVVASTLGCSDPPPPTVVVPPPPVPVLPIAAPRPVASSIAFDLVHTPSGAVVAWGSPARLGGGVRALALDPVGAPRGTEVEIVRGTSADEARVQIEELTIASSGTRVGIAWVLASLSTPAVYATFSSQETEGLATPSQLGETVSLVPGSRAARGRVAMSTREDGALVVTHRLTDAPCSEAVLAELGAPDARCARIARSELDALVADPDPTSAMEVPAPCPSLLPGAVTTAGTWFFGICHLTPAPLTTLYAIRPSISYAAANDTLVGCMPEAVAPLVSAAGAPEGAAVIGACEGAPRIAFIDANGRETSAVSAPSLDVACEAGRPVIVISGAAPARRVPLLGAVSRIEGLLPERIAPRGARATWTGAALIVATPLEGEVSLRRYECRELGLVRTDIP